jgi:hypothetical protein
LEVHKPKPVHGWRDFLSEITVIVIGIVIALSAEQMLQGLELRSKVRHAEEQMRVELALDDGPQVLQRIALAPCVEQSLTRIRAAVEQNEPRAQVLEAVERFDPPRHTWDSVAFQAATVNNVLPHLPADRLWRWAYVYAMMPLLDRANEREFLDVARLRSLSKVGGPLSDAERARLIEAVEMLRRDNEDIVKHVTATEGAIRELGVRVVLGAKPPSEIYAPAGPSRVLDQLKGLPMAASCVPALEQAMRDSP